MHDNYLKDKDTPTIEEIMNMSAVERGTAIRKLRAAETERMVADDLYYQRAYLIDLLYGQDDLFTYHNDGFHHYVKGED